MALLYQPQTYSPGAPRVAPRTPVYRPRTDIAGGPTLGGPSIANPATTQFKTDAITGKSIPGIAAGTVAGAGTGAAFGPYGAAIGGIVGGGSVALADALGADAPGNATAAPTPQWGGGPGDAAGQEGAALTYGPGYANFDSRLGAGNAAYLGTQGQGEAGAFAKLGQRALTLTPPAPAQATAEGALGILGNAAAGRGPSAAQAQLQSGLEQSIAAQNAAANSVRGGFGLANAGYQAAQNIGQLEGNAANASAQLRAQEMQNAENAYLGGSENLLAQGTGAQQFGLSTALAAQGKSADTLLNYEGAGMGNQLDLQRLGQGGNLGFGQLAAGIGGAQGSLALGAAGQQNQVNLSNAQNNENLFGSALNAGGAGLATSIRGQQPPPQAGPAAPQQTPPTTSGTNPNDGDISFAGTGSDARVKREASYELPPDGARAADEFMGAAKPRTFAYADPQYEPEADGEGGTFLGFHAQDLERSHAGRQAVVHDASGIKHVNPVTLGFANTASVGRLHERLSALESRFGMRRAG